jgi:outer membrane receptor protein involved in Fe transport
MSAFSRPPAMRLAAAIVTLTTWLSPLHAQGQESTVEGRVHSGSRGIAHVTVDVVGQSMRPETDSDGRYRIPLPPGTYDLVLRFAGFEQIEHGVAVKADATVFVDSAVDWPVFDAGMVTVTAPTLRPEPILASSAAVTSLLGSEVAVEATHGQFPRVLAATPGVQLTQSGLYDFNLNARGFNAAANRQVKTLIDGRDPSVPVLLGYQDWAANSFSLNELEQAELIRGPGGALYGAGAFNGVLSLTTKAPADSAGGFGRFTFGGLDTTRVEVRHAGRINDTTRFKVTGGYHHSRDFTRSRVGGGEYAGLPPEVIAPPKDHLDIAFGSVRVDHDFSGNRFLVGEAGTASVKGMTTVTSAGRTQSTDNARPWARVQFTSPHWRATGYYSGQNTDGQVGLSTGTPIYFDASNAEGEVVANRDFAAGRGNVIAGGSVGIQRADSADPQGVQTVFSSTQTLDREAIFGQAAYQITKRLRALAAARVDWSEIHDTQLSPRAAIVYQLSPQHALHTFVSRAFQSPSLPELFLATAVAPPVDLSALEVALAPVLGGTALGFQHVPVLALGNRHLRVEEVESFEAGYSGIVARRAYVTLNYYRSRLSDFASDLLPQVGTSLGRLNPDFGPYAPPSTLPAGASAYVLGALDAALPPELRPFLSNDASGAPVFAALSLTNTGRVTTQGLEAGVNAVVATRWRIDGSYTLFDHDLEETAAVGTVSPNTARHQWAAGLTYDAARLSAAVRYRWVDSFSWASGLFAGPVPSYDVTDVQATYKLTRSIDLGLDVANAFNNEHYEIFGGDLLRRRVLVSTRYSW